MRGAAVARPRGRQRDLAVCGGPGALRKPILSSHFIRPVWAARAGPGWGRGRPAGLLPAPASETQLPRPRPWIEGPREPPLLSTRSPETLCKRQRQGRVSYRKGGRGGRGAPWRARHPGCTPNAGTGGRGLDPQCHRTHLPTTPAGARVVEGGMRGLTTGRTTERPPHHPGSGVPVGMQGHRQEGLLVPRRAGELPGTSMSLWWGLQTSGLAALPTSQDETLLHTPPGTNSPEKRRCWLGRLDSRAEAPGCPITASARRPPCPRVKGTDASLATRLGRDGAARLRLEGTSEPPQISVSRLPAARGPRGAGRPAQQPLLQSPLAPAEGRTTHSMSRGLGPRPAQRPRPLGLPDPLHETVCARLWAPHRLT